MGLFLHNFTPYLTKLRGLCLCPFLFKASRPMHSSPYARLVSGMNNAPWSVRILVIRDRHGLPPLWPQELRKHTKVSSVKNTGWGQVDQDFDTHERVSACMRTNIRYEVVPGRSVLFHHIGTSGSDLSRWCVQTKRLLGEGVSVFFGITREDGSAGCKIGEKLSLGYVEIAKDCKYPASLLPIVVVILS